MSHRRVAGNRLHFPRFEGEKTLQAYLNRSIDTDIANDSSSAANMAVSAEFAAKLAAKLFIGNVGLNNLGMTALEMTF